MAQTYIKINPALSAEQNMLALINAALVQGATPFALGDYTLSNPVSVSTTEFNNTQVVITPNSGVNATAATKLYHRADVGLKGAENGADIKTIAKRLKAKQKDTLAETLTAVAQEVGLVATEFDIEKVKGNANYNFKLTAKAGSHLYIGVLGVNLGKEAQGSIEASIPAFRQLDSTDTNIAQVVTGKTAAAQLSTQLEKALKGNLTIEQFNISATSVVDDDEHFNSSVTLTSKDSDDTGIEKPAVVKYNRVDLAKYKEVSLTSKTLGAKGKENSVAAANQYVKEAFTALGLDENSIRITEATGTIDPATGYTGNIIVEAIENSPVTVGRVTIAVELKEAPKLLKPTEVDLMVSYNAPNYSTTAPTHFREHKALEGSPTVDVRQ